MSKLSSVITLAAVTALLAGCGSAAGDDTRPVVTKSVSPSAVPTEEATPEPEETTPAETPSPEPTPEPTVEPAPEVPEEPVPTIEPLPVGPNDPFVPPPHGEPNPMLPPTPHSDPAYFLDQTIDPVPNSVPTPTRSMKRGGTLTVVGSGYDPGQEVYVGLGWPHTDYNYIQGPTTAIADQNGYISFPISISTALPAHDYVVMTVPLGVEPQVREAAKRYYNIILEAN